VTLVLLAAACTPSPVEWAVERSVTPAPGEVGALAADGAIVPDSMASLAARIAVPPGAICPGSLRLARTPAAVYAVWWAPRADSGARLLAAHSTDGGRNWSAAAPVDTADRAVNGCRREPPAIAADPLSGYVHVTYALQAPEGPGVFFSHSMDRGISFHAPVPILYGERLGRTSVAADGDLVVVGFEDPNSRTPRIGLAISRTMGHIFEDRLLPVSGDHGAATYPLTAVRGRRIAVSWEQRSTDTTPGVRAVRVGVVR
jgi:hypothetical protein